MASSAAVRNKENTQLPVVEMSPAEAGADFNALIRDSLLRNPLPVTAGHIPGGTGPGSLFWLCHGRRPVQGRQTYGTKSSMKGAPHRKGRWRGGPEQQAA